MPRYALINTSNNSLIELRTYAAQPANPSGKPRKWLPCAIVSAPSFNPETEILEGPNYAVNANDVTEAFSVRSMTAQELSDRKDNHLDRMELAVLRGMFNVHNRVRVLEGQPADTAVQFRAKLKALL